MEGGIIFVLRISQCLVCGMFRLPVPAGGRRLCYLYRVESLDRALEQFWSSAERSRAREFLLLESKIQEAKSKKDTLRARAQSAKTSAKVTEMLGNVNTSSGLAAFEKMEEKVLAMESQAEALNQLSADDLEGKFALLKSSSVDDDLADLRKELSGASKVGGDFEYGGKLF
ncbi:hypothetical protein MLD38_035804 [Melastoma candidum]|uniref:Uncharacterized protein n=1 Tax=Melastoma candidum TaxID=119954 RepID=A0ACB9LIY8_9MYRT|nr:hypothetical protein MLD38_035804 [Melastoma candidum]